VTLLDIFALLVLLTLIGTVIYILYFLGGWPGRIANEHDHPQAAAVNICGWLGLITGVSWVIAMVWAFWQYPRRDLMAVASPPDDVAQRIRGLESRLNALEARVVAQRGDES